MSCQWHTLSFTCTSHPPVLQWPWTNIVPLPVFTARRSELAVVVLETRCYTISIGVTHHQWQRCTESIWKVWPDVVYSNTAVCDRSPWITVSAYTKHWPRSEWTFNPFRRRMATFMCCQTVTGRSAISSDEQKDAFLLETRHIAAYTDGTVFISACVTGCQEGLWRLHKQASVTHFQVLVKFHQLSGEWVWGSINGEQRNVQRSRLGKIFKAWFDVRPAGAGSNGSPAYLKWWKIADLCPKIKYIFDQNLGGLEKPTHASHIQKQQDVSDAWGRMRGKRERNWEAQNYKKGCSVSLKRHNKMHLLSFPAIKFTFIELVRV